MDAPRIRKTLAIPRGDGGVSIMRLYGNDPTAEMRAITNYAAEHPELRLLAPIVIDEESLPKDETFRDAWTVVGNRIEVNMPKARALHMSRIRAARDRELARTDALWMRVQAIGAGASMAVRSALETERQRLRDIPQTLDLTTVKTPSELGAVWPAWLPMP